jgi:nucleotide-binding universal stress UspA family protein
MEARETARGDMGESWVKRIVVAADGSPASTQGLEQVKDLAQRIGASVVVVHVRHLPPAALMASGVDGQPVLESLDQLESEVRRQAIRILHGTGIEWKLVVRAGGPGDEIVKVAAEAAADLVVVGSNRHSSLHNLLLGSTAAYLTAHSPVPVLVMRSPALSGAVPLAAATR